MVKRPRKPCLHHTYVPLTPNVYLPMLPFRKCHLQILRSLYDCKGGQGDGDSNSSALLGDAVGANDGSNGGGGGRGENGNEGNGDAAGSSTSDAMEIGEANVKREKSDRDAAGNDNVNESPVCSGVWVLIDRFLQQRKEYRPHEQRHLHWLKVNAEAKSRLDHLLSMSSSVEEDDIRPSQSRLSLTPRTPIFSMSRRGSTSNLSLTPLSSNRNPPRSSQSDRDVASAIPSWNLINQMVRRRSRLCNRSCQSFRSQPFLAELQNEAQMRCEVLETVLVNLNTGKRKNNAREAMIHLLSGKRQKLGMDVYELTAPSLFGHLCSSKYSESVKTDLDAEGDCYEDYIVETKMKIHLWSSLLLSLKEIS